MLCLAVLSRVKHVVSVLLCTSAGCELSRVRSFEILNDGNNGIDC